MQTAFAMPDTDSCRNVLVTGATGFLGGHVVRDLLDRGHRVTVASRRAFDCAGLTRCHVIGNIDGRTDWTRALVGIDAVVHLAGRAHRRASVQADEADLFAEINIEGTRRLASAAVDAGVRHFVYVSSIAVNGSSTTGRPPFRPEDEPRPRTTYGMTKLKAERELSAIQAREPALCLDLLRCPVVIGKGAPGSLALMEWALARRLPLPFATIRNRRMFLALDDLTSFVARRLKHPTGGRHCFTLASPDTISTPDLVRLMAEALGMRPRLVPWPPQLVRLPLILARRQDKADALTADLEIDIRAARGTGWSPSSSIETAVAKAFRPT